MRSLPAFFSAAALAVALQVQSISSNFSNIWLYFLLIASVLMIYKSGGPKYHGHGEQAIPYTLGAWLLLIGASCSILAPMPGSKNIAWALAAFPILALSIHRQDMKNHLKNFYIVILIYALGLILQMYLQVKYTNFDYVGRYAWPLLNPNNAAAVINFALLPSLYLGLRKPKWLISVGILLIALYATHSRAGVMSFGVGSLILLWERFGCRVGIASLVIALVMCVSVGFAKPEAFNTDSMKNRFDIWSTTTNMVLDLDDVQIGPGAELYGSSIFGYGLGSFPLLYQQFRTEKISSGYFAHNDLLQFWVEMDNYAVLIFLFLVIVTALSTHRGNIISGVVMLALLLQAMLEFQFYVPAISILMGLAMAYHLLNLQRDYATVEITRNTA